MHKKIHNMVKSSFFIALGLVLPFCFHQFGLGQVFLPMHIPVLLCGFIIGKKYGVIVGLLTPILSSLLTGMPPIYPIAIAMALELATYGFVSGFSYKNKKINIFISLTISMILGRLVSGTANCILFSMAGKTYAFKMFITASFVQPIWGIILQFISIPFIVKCLEKFQNRTVINE